MSSERNTPVRVAHITTIDLTVRYLLLPQLKRLQREGYEVTSISAPGEHVEVLEREGIRHIPWSNATRGWDVTSDARAFFELVRILRRERFDVVHTHNPKPGVLGRIAARVTGVPVVINTQHGFYATPDDRFRRKAAVLSAEWIAARFSDRELYQSEEDFSWVGRIHLARPPKTVLLGNGVDVDFFDAGSVNIGELDALRFELGIPSGACVVGTVGRLVEEKGYRELFVAAAELRKQMPELCFLVVGGADPEKWDSLSQELVDGAKEHVIFAGHRDNVRDLLALMDVFVLPSWREGVPRSVIEAAAMGRPLIVTDIRGCREVVRHGIEGYLVVPRDPERLAFAIRSLARDPALRSRMGSAARARAVDRFDENRVQEQIVKEYRALLGSSPEMAAPPITLRPGVPADAATLARMHRQTVPTAFLPTLGDRFTALLYRQIAAASDSFLIVAEDAQGRTVGFVAVATSVGGLYRRFLRRSGMRALIAVAPRLVRPKVIRRALETARYPEQTHALPPSEILVWSVDPSGRSMGIGAALLDRSLTELARRGIEKTKIVVYAENDRANKVLDSGGWTVATTLNVHGSQMSNVWTHPCHSSSPS